MNNRRNGGIEIIGVKMGMKIALSKVDKYELMQKAKPRKKCHGEHGSHGKKHTESTDYTD